LRNDPQKLNNESVFRTPSSISSMVFAYFRI